MADFEYFRAEESDQFSFFRIPKALFSEKEFASLSTDAKLLYGILLDRISLSKKNGWIDSEGYVYIIYTIAELQELLRMSHTTVTKLLYELDSVHGIGSVSYTHLTTFCIQLEIGAYGQTSKGQETMPFPSRVGKTGKHRFRFAYKYRGRTDVYKRQPLSPVWMYRKLPIPRMAPILPERPPMRAPIPPLLPWAEDVYKRQRLPCAPVLLPW